MTIMFDAGHRGWVQGSAHGGVCLNDKFEIIKDIGDGSFGSVALARVRTAGSHIARRGTLIAIKTMKKTYESFSSCLELREIIFLRTLPHHPHLVPALDIFLDPLSKKLHIAMEYMDGNLYQLMKAREHKPFDSTVVKSVLCQIFSGLEHIHHHNFFHRDIKPENILVSVSSREDFGSAFKRYSQLITPPPTPPTYTIKIADFGLAREMHSKSPYTTYVSTRWYRAPEVLLRAGEYSAPVDMWAMGAMAVEIATLKPLFPGGNEVDQVWRVCEILGSPGNWVNKQNQKVGGGPWKDSAKLAQKLGFSFPKMAPHTLDTILKAPQWPASLCDLITWCLMWDPNNRPTSSQALSHEYFNDAFDPLLPKLSNSRRVSRKPFEVNIGPALQTSELPHTLTSKTSAWFRKSLITRESAPAVPQHTQTMAPMVSVNQPMSPRPSPVKVEEVQSIPAPKARPYATKRATWANGLATYGAPMPILPSIRPISPISNHVTAQAHAETDHDEFESTKKIGRQLSLLSRGTQPTDVHRQEAERALIGSTGDMTSPTTAYKEGFFSHLRKRARRISARHQFPPTPNGDDLEANAGCAPWAAGRHLMSPELPVTGSMSKTDFAELDHVMQNLQNVSYNVPPQSPVKNYQKKLNNSLLKRHHSVPRSEERQSQVRGPSAPTGHVVHAGTTHRVPRKPLLSTRPFGHPDEQEEILDEALASAQAAVNHLDQQQRRASDMFYGSTSPYGDEHPLRSTASEMILHAPYPTPSTSEKRNTSEYGRYYNDTHPMDISPNKQRTDSGYPFPTPPYDDNEWAAAAAAAIFGAGDRWK